MGSGVAERENVRIGVFLRDIQADATPTAPKIEYGHPVLELCAITVPAVGKVDGRMGWLTRINVHCCV